MTMTELSTLEYQIIWVVGAAERLATLGYLEEVPLRIPPNGIDLFLEADRNVNALFKSDFEIVQLFKQIATSDSDDEVDENDLDCMTKLILEYKNNRYKMFQHSLSQQSI